MNRIAALVLALAFCPLAASAQPVFDGFEAAEIEACRGDGAWVQDAAVYTYFKDSYYDLDVRFRAFIGTAPQRVKTAAATDDPEQRAARFAFLHAQVIGIIPRLGRLLPRMEHTADLAPMIGQMLNSEILGPQGDRHTEFLRVALAREMLNVPASTASDPGPRIAAFLTSVRDVEELLMTLKNGQDGVMDLEALNASLAALNLGWRDGFRPIAEKTIFGNYANSLQGRLAFTVKEICAARLTCSTIGPDAPMDCGGATDGDL